ncbi:MAG: DUF5110 domain-containing protein [Planctomycetes bacterium]|nr:DUF5110 domain-containing protein [Planctomycetota bacterium]
MRRACLLAVALLAVCGRYATARGVVREGNCVIVGNVRFTVISPTLLRLEYSREGAFVDAPSLVATERNWGKVDLQLHEKKGRLEIATQKLLLRYTLRSGRFNPLNLEIEMMHGEKMVTWRPGMVSEGNLGGAGRRLDAAAGPASLPEGILSRDGWYVLDDSRTPILVNGWPAPRGDVPAQDIYFFGYGNDYEQALRDFNDLSGRVPMPPEWALGVWLLCDWPLSGDEVINTVRGLHEKKIPLNALVISHWNKNGWTSYDWDTNIFPDPAAFLKKMHDFGVKVGLNIHPGGALLPMERGYANVTKLVGWDPTRRGMIFFDLGERREAQALTKVLIPPLEKQGVDFWWVDGAAAVTMRHLGAQWWTNRVFFTGSRVENNKRALILGEYGGLGSNRFPMTLSGFLKPTWRALDFLTYYTPTAGNAGVAYLANVVSGGPETKPDGELFVRWLQLCTASPLMILRTHNGRMPWADDPKLVAAVTKSLRLREVLLPYLYTLANRMHTRGLPICRPMYLRYPDANEAYEFRHQYMLGMNLLVAPMARPAAGRGLAATRRIWFPPGEWHGFTTARIIQGPTVLNYASELSHMPAFAKAGSIVPLAQSRGAPPLQHERLTLEIYSGEPGQFELYMDDGTSRAYADGRCARCIISYFEDEQARIVRIGEIKGNYKGKPTKRSYQVRLNTFLSVEGVAVNGVAMKQLPKSGDNEGWRYDIANGRLVVNTPALPTSEAAEVVFVGDFKTEDRRLAYLLREVISRLESAAILLLQNKGPDELVETIREIETFAENAALRICAGPVMREDLQAGVDSIRARIVQLVTQANQMILNDAVKLQFMKAIVGVSLSSRIIPTPYRQVTVRTEMRFLPYGWGEISGTTIVANQPPHSITLLRPKGNVFFETDVGISALPLEEVAFDVRADITWNGVPVQLALTEAMNNTFIKQFYVIGPFGNGSYRRMTEMSFPPERYEELAASYVGKRRQIVAWKKLPWQAPVHTYDEDGRPGRDFRFVDLGRSLKRVPPSAGYAITRVFVPKDTTAKLLLGSHGGITVWVNGVEVFRESYMKYDKPDQEAVATRLGKGWNTIRVKAVDEGSRWGFYLRLVGEDGAPIPGAMSGWGPGF